MKLVNNFDTDNVLVFKSFPEAFLYITELKNQIINGKYECTGPKNHWKWTSNVGIIVDENITESGFIGDLGGKHYNLNEWFSPDYWTTFGARIAAYVAFSKLVPESMWKQAYKEAFNIGMTLSHMYKFGKTKTSIHFDPIDPITYKLNDSMVKWKPYFDKLPEVTIQQKEVKEYHKSLTNVFKNNITQYDEVA